MKRITPIARVLLGLVFFVFSLNYFVPFLPAPSGMPEPALAFVGAFAASGLLTLIKVVELCSSIALLANRAVPLALTLVAPIIVGITGFHAAFEPSGLPLALGLIALELVLAWSYRASFAPMVRFRVAPDPILPLTRVPDPAVRAV